MRKYNYPFPILIDRFDKHDLVKDELLRLINDAEPDEDRGEITAVDWFQSRHFDRPWVEFILEDFKNQLIKMVSTLGCERIALYEIWYQQYANKSTHDWHVHGFNYTGVYYVDMSDGCASTRLSNETNPYVHSDPSVQEGDVIIFPSTLKHRALVQNVDYTKTIISFNFDFDYFPEEYITTIDNSVGVDFETYRDIRGIYRK